MLTPKTKLWTQKPELFTTEISTNCTFWAQQYNLRLSKLNLSMLIRIYSRTIINRLEQLKQTSLLTKRHICIGCHRIIWTCIFSTIISTALKPLKIWIPIFFWNTHQKAKLNATHLPSPLMTPFRHYFRLALKICFSLCAQVPNRQLLTRGTFPDSTIERLTSYLLEGLQIKCETSWISVVLKFSSRWSGQRRKVASSASPEDTENHTRSLTPRSLQRKCLKSATKWRAS